MGKARMELEMFQRLFPKDLALHPQLCAACLLDAQTNCTFLSLVSLVNYGNWCGPGSNEKDPVDAIDTCCQAHDMCYDTIDKSGLCDGLHPPLVTYQFEPTLKGTLACTDCSAEKLVNRRSVK